MCCICWTNLIRQFMHTVGLSCGSLLLLLRQCWNGNGNSSSIAVVRKFGIWLDFTLALLCSQRLTHFIACASYVCAMCAHSHKHKLKVIETHTSDGGAACFCFRALNGMSMSCHNRISSIRPL